MDVLNMKIFLWSLKIITVVTVPDELNDNYKRYFHCYYNKYNEVDDPFSKNEKREKFVSDVVSLSMQNKYEISQVPTDQS